MSDEKTYSLGDFDFDLPEGQIAQYPAREREESRLFVLHRDAGRYEHRMFRQLGDYLREGDLLVLNDARVIPARVSFRRFSGAAVEFILVRRIDERRWYGITNKSKRLKEGEVLYSAGDPCVTITIAKRREDFFEIESSDELTEDILNVIGEIPLPPYIRRKARWEDQDRYQTVYADRGGAVASPTAGLHFSRRMMEDLAGKGIRFVYLTLFVSWGTFLPVRVEDLSRHKMHAESYRLPEESAREINCAREEGRRVVAVGTTSLRVLESTMRSGKNMPGVGETDIFIRPPCEIRSIDALLTNFHTPCSTLLMLVAAFAGYGRIMDAYGTAVRERYRFFSYGDAMLIL